MAQPIRDPDDPILAWAVAHGTREADVQRRLRAETRAMPNAIMQIGPDQGQVLQFLVRMTGARRVLEIGTFTGYSALSMALGLPPDGRLVACDVSAEWTAIGRRYWEEAGVADRIDLRLGPAKDTLVSLLETDGPGSFDFAFIDADKDAYRHYYEACLRLVRPGGIIAIDNMLMFGAVADPTDERPAIRVLRALADQIRDDPRVDMCLLTIGDGVALVRPR